MLLADYIDFKNVKRMVDLLFLDGTDFSKYLNFYCKAESENYDLLSAISKCREDVDCSMVSSLVCNNDTSQYQICGKFPTLIRTEESCTFRKKGNFMKLYNLVDGSYIMVSIKIFQIAVPIEYSAWILVRMGTVGTMLSYMWCWT